MEVVEESTEKFTIMDEFLKCRMADIGNPLLDFQNFVMEIDRFSGHAEDIGPPLARLCNLTGSTLLYYVHISSNFE